MPAKRAQFFERCDPLQAPDVIAGHIDVLPSERRQMRQITGCGLVPLVAQVIDGTLQVGRIP